MPKHNLPIASDSLLRVCRTEAALSQQQLGEQVGLSRQTIIAIENGQSQPSLKHAVRLARIFGKTVESLFGKEKPGPL